LKRIEIPHFKGSINNTHIINEPNMKCPKFLGRKVELSFLKENLNYHNYINIFGPKGIGKTVLIGKYLSDNSQNFHWFNLNDDDNEINSIIQKLALISLEQPGNEKDYSIKYKLKLLLNNKDCSFQDFNCLLYSIFNSLENKIFVFDNFLSTESHTIFRILMENIYEVNRQRSNKIFFISRPNISNNNLIYPLKLNGLKSLEFKLFVTTQCNFVLLEKDLQELLWITEGNPLIVKFVLESLSTDDNFYSISDQLGLAHNFRRIQEIFYQSLSKFNKNELRFLRFLIQSLDPLKKIIPKGLNLDKYVQEGIIDDHKEFYSISEITWQYLKSFYNI